MDNVRGVGESSSSSEPRLTLDPEETPRLREKCDQVEREKAEIMKRLEKIRKLRRRLIGP